MRIARLAAAALLVLASVPEALAQLSCDDPDSLCTGDPCVITNAEVESPCIVDFGNRAVEIRGILRVPDDGILQFTAGAMLVLGPIDGRHVGNGVGRGARITLVATAGDVDLRREIDVSGTAATGTIDVQALAGSIFVSDPLNAKPAGSNFTASGGTIALAAQMALETGPTAVIDVEGGGGSVAIRGDAGTTIKGRVRAVGNPSGTISIASADGSVTLDKDLRIENDRVAAGTVEVSAKTDVTVNDVIHAESEDATGGNVTLTSDTGTVVINVRPSLRGASGGSLTINAPLGVVDPPRLDANARSDAGGSIAITAATINVAKNLDVRGKIGIGGTIALTATNAVNMNGGDLRASGGYGGGIILRGGAASGDVNVAKTSLLTASGSPGDGGYLIISAPAGTVSVQTKANVSGRRAAGGHVLVDGDAIMIAASRFDTYGRTFGGEIRFQQSGTGLLSLSGLFDARRGGVIEGSAPSGSLKACGNYRAAPGGCVVMTAGGSIDTSCAVSDTLIGTSCP